MKEIQARKLAINLVFGDQENISCEMFDPRSEVKKRLTGVDAVGVDRVYSIIPHFSHFKSKGKHLLETWTNAGCGYDSVYEASSRGRVRSQDRLTYAGHGSTRFVHGHLIRPRKLSDGFMWITLSKNGVTQTMLLHELIFASFSELPAPDEIAHMDGDRSNNSYKNLFGLWWDDSLKDR